MTRRLSPELAIGLLALFIAMGGSAYAATKLAKNSVGTVQLRPSAVETSDIKDGAVTSAKLAGVHGGQTSSAPVPDRADYAERAGSAGRADAADRADLADTAARATAVDAVPFAARIPSIGDADRLGGKDALDFLPSSLVVDLPRFSLTDGEERMVLDLGPLVVTARCNMNLVTSNGIVDRADMVVGTSEEPGVLDGLHSLTARLRPDSPDEQRMLIDVSSPSGTPGFAASADGTFGVPDGTEVRSAVVHAGVNVFGQPDKCFFGGFFLV